MSVAFRRESDEDHKEPKFEIPLPAGPNLVTARGLALLDAKVAEVEATVAAAADDETREAAKRELRYWHTRQTTAEVAPPPEDGVVGIGSRVTVRMNRAKRVVEIVGADEADPATGRVGFQAPLAQALMHAEVGETVEFNGGTIDVLEIERSA